MNEILLFVPDLFFSSKIEDVAHRLGYRTENIRADGDLERVLTEKRPRLVLVAFERTGSDWERVVEAARHAGVRAIAFGSHRNIEAFRRAKDLGCSDVVANSRLSAELPDLLKKWMG